MATAALRGQAGTAAPNASSSELVSVGEDGTLRCLDCATRALLAATHLGGAAPTAVAASGSISMLKVLF